MGIHVDDYYGSSEISNLMPRWCEPLLFAFHLRDWDLGVRIEPWWNVEILRVSGLDLNIALATSFLWEARAASFVADGRGIPVLFTHQYDVLVWACRVEILAFHQALLITSLGWAGRGATLCATPLLISLAGDRNSKATTSSPGSPYGLTELHSGD